LVGSLFAQNGGSMTQGILPIFPHGSNEINRFISFEIKDDRVYYFQGLMPIFSHDKYDLQSFRFITSQLYINGNIKQSEICRTFGVTDISVKRAVKTLRTQGLKGFSSKQAKKRSNLVLTPKVLSQIQSLLDKGVTPSEIARKKNLKADTINKAIRNNLLKKTDR